jgi:hypothetical protein
MRLQDGKHDVRPCEHLRDGGRGVRETLRVNDRRRAWPDDADHGRHAVRFDEFDRELIMVDLTGGEGCGGMLGQGGAPFRLGPVLELLPPGGPDLCDEVSTRPNGYFARRIGT